MIGEKCPIFHRWSNWRTYIGRVPSCTVRQARACRRCGEIQDVECAKDLALLTALFGKREESKAA